MIQPRNDQPVERSHTEPDRGPPADVSLGLSTVMIQPRNDQPVERSSDFHQRYATAFNPYDYELWVCPNDLYAALPADFSELADKDRPNLRETVRTVVDAWR